METSTHHVLPQSITVSISEHDTFFHVNIEFATLVQHNFVNELEDDEATSELETNWYPDQHEHQLFVWKDASYSSSRDEILTKLKLAFPNHEYKLYESDEDQGEE